MDNNNNYHNEDNPKQNQNTYQQNPYLQNQYNGNLQQSMQNNPQVNGHFQSPQQLNPNSSNQYQNNQNPNYNYGGNPYNNYMQVPTKKHFYQRNGCILAIILAIFCITLFCAIVGFMCYGFLNLIVNVKNADDDYSMLAYTYNGALNNLEDVANSVPNSPSEAETWLSDYDNACSYLQESCNEILYYDDSEDISYSFQKVITPMASAASDTEYAVEQFQSSTNELFSSYSPTMAENDYLNILTSYINSFSQFLMDMQVPVNEMNEADQKMQNKYMFSIN